jgi:hypothetical protein
MTIDENKPTLIVECPGCKVKTRVILLGGKQGVCNNIKCYIDRFTVQGFNPTSSDDGRHNKSYNNSGRR